jgi:methylation protein EvaC
MTTCALCSSSKLIEILDFGDVALAGGFLKKEDVSNEKKYPLTLVFCEECYGVQVRDHIDPDVLFSTDFYFSSAIGTLKNHFREYAKEVVERFLPSPSNSVTLEFGSNDGVLLKPVKRLGVGTVIGVEPAKNIVESIDDDTLVVVNDFFNVKVAKELRAKYGAANLIMANNVFAHITDINGTTSAVYEMLDENGVFSFEVHYLGSVIEGMQYDFIYHEHIYYYSLLALENHFRRHDMVIFDIKHVPIHGGSIRFYAAKKTGEWSNYKSEELIKQRALELEKGYNKAETYKNFRTKVELKKQELMNTVNDILSRGKVIVGYGASGRANTIIQYCGITNEHIKFMVDDAPAKTGLYTPGSHIEIKNSGSLILEKPDYVLIFAWAFSDEIIRRNGEYFNSGGKYILPLPEVKIY